MENWIETIIDELVSLHISKQICSNPSYQNKRKQIVLLHEAIEKLLRSIDDNGLKLFQKYVELVESQEYSLYRIIYISAINDSLKVCSNTF